jgi:hypothetical protein
MNQHLRRVTSTIVVATALTASGVLLVAAATEGGSTSSRTPAQTRATTAPACLPAPAPCGSDSLDELAIHAANEAARRMLEQQTTGTTSVTNATR